MRDLRVNSPIDSSEPTAISSRIGGDIDVVIPVHNGARYIRECIESVFSQTLQPRRIIVVDDGSTDETVAIVSAIQRLHPTLILYKMERNAGVSAARNAGIGLSGAPLLAFIDADDVWLPNKLALQREVLENSRRPVGLVHSSFFLIDEAGNVLAHERGHQTLLRGDAFSRLLRERKILSGSASAVLIRRDFLDRTGLFDDQLYYGEDWDLWLRLAAIAEVDHTPEAVVGIRVRTTAAQPAKQGGVDRFLQTMRVYSRWEREVRDEGIIVKELRKDGFRAAVTDLHSFKDLMSFYRTLKSSKQNLTSSLYASEPDFWSGLALAAVTGACGRLSRLIVRKSRRQSSGFGGIK